MNYSERKLYAEELVRQDKYPEALIEYSALFKENPKDPENIERFLFLFKRINDGNYDFQPDSTDQFVMRGVAKFYNGEFENSINDFNEALSLDSNNHYALKTRAFSLKTIGRLDEAISDLKKAIEISPTGEYYDDLSEIYQLNGDYETAISYHHKAIEISPNDARLWYNYAIDLGESGKLNEALVKFNRAIELWPEYEDAIVNREHTITLIKNRNRGY